jgi:hypothetical protein
MDDKRKSIIVNEILFWKSNRILPEQYCDYLLALYTEGQDSPEFMQPSYNKTSRYISYLFLLAIPIFVVLIYFTELSFTLQIGLNIFFVIIELILVYYFFKKGKLMQIPLISSALLILLLSVEVISNIFPNTPEAQYLTVGFNCLLWLLTGWRFKLIYLLISGVLGIILLVVSLFLR